MPSDLRSSGTLTPNLLGPLLDGDRRGSRDLLRRLLHDGMPRLDLYETVVAPCLREIGRLWQHAEITVPDEHRASDTLTAALGALRPPAITHRQAPTVVIASAPGNHHLLGASLAWDLLADAGWRTWFVGDAMGTEELVAFTRLRRPRLLVLAVTEPSRLAGAVEVADGLRGAGDATTVLTGGAGVARLQDPSLIGADALAHDYRELMAFADGLGAVRAGAVAAWPEVPRTTVERALGDADGALSLNELRAACSTPVAQISIELQRLECLRRVRFVAGRWKLTGRDA